MNRRHAFKRLTTFVAALLLPSKASAQTPLNFGPDGFPNRMHAEDPGAWAIKAVYVDGQKQEDVVAFDRAAGWVEYLDLNNHAVHRLRWGRVTVEWQAP